LFFGFVVECDGLVDETAKKALLTEHFGTSDTKAREYNCRYSVLT